MKRLVFLLLLYAGVALSIAVLVAKYGVPYPESPDAGLRQLIVVVTATLGFLVSMGLAIAIVVREPRSPS